MNIQVSQILELLKSQWGNIPREYMILLYFIGTVFAALNCFMGYRLRKVWGCILGILAGAGSGAVAGFYFLQDKTLAILCAGAGAFIFGLLAWLLYKFGVFVMCSGLVYALVISWLDDPTMMQHMIAASVGVFAGTFALGYEKQMVIGITSVCGGFGAIHLLLAMTEKEAKGGELILGIVMAVIGAAVQFFGLMKGKDSSKRGTKRAVNKMRYADVENKPQRDAAAEKKSGNEHSVAEDEYAPVSKREELDKTQEYTLGQRQYENSRANQSQMPYMGSEIGIDLDDLNRELSQEIQKIYKDENE